MIRRLVALIVLVHAGAISAHALPNEVTYAIRAELDPATSRITARETVRVVNRTGRALGVLYFHLYPNAFDREHGSTYLDEMREFDRPELHFLTAGASSSLAVGTVATGGAPVPFHVTRDLMEVRLPSSLAADEAISLDISFVTTLGAIAERSGTWDGNYAVGQWFPKLVVHDENGWALEHNGAYHFTGEFYGDFGSYDVELTLPRDFKVGATGHERETRTAADGRTTHVFHAEHVHDFAWTADPRYLETTLHAAGVTVHVLARDPASTRLGEYARKILEYCSRRIGPFPYEDFTVAETYYNGTMEYPQIIFVRTWPAWLGRWVERELTRLQELYVAHETTHQWFYGAIGNNEMVDAWLDEGFTAYFEEAYMRDTYRADDNILRLTSLLRVRQKEVGDAIWRALWPVVPQPIQTPAYRFDTPDAYVSSVYYGTALFFRQFESLLGTPTLDRLFAEYFRRTKFRNARPEDWYGVVRDFIGPEAEEWWRRWIGERLVSDYELVAVESEATPNGKFRHRVTVRQNGNHLVPVPVRVTDEKGGMRQAIVAIREGSPSAKIDFTTDAPLADVEVDPGHDAPDVDRFNNRPGLFPSVELWPFTSSRVREDAITLVPFPYFLKRPGIGSEAGLGVLAAHYFDWYGSLFTGYDFRHRSVTVAADFASLAPNRPWGWEASAEQTVLADRKHVYLSKRLDPPSAREARHELLAGPEYAGDLGDGRRALGLGIEYRFSALHNGRDLRWSLAVHNSVARDLETASGVDKLYAKARVIVPIAFKSYLDVKGIYGGAFGTLGRSFQYDLQASDEGGMRFDWADVGDFKTSRIAAANIELQFGLPYGTWADGLAVVHGPRWDVHFFADVSNSPTGGRTLFDAGVGTRVKLSTGAFGDLGINLEIVPYQSAVAPTGWQLPPLVFLSLAEYL